jgi:hypothetical protein
VIVYNGAGLVMSAPAVLTVRVPVPPTILQQPADVTVDAGLPANICMAFGGTPPFSVQMNRWNGARVVADRLAIPDRGQCAHLRQHAEPAVLGQRCTIPVSSRAPQKAVPTKP